MGIEAKTSFTKRMEGILSHLVTVDQAGLIMAAVSDALQHYDINETESGVDSQDDLLDAYAADLSVSCKSQKTIDRYVYIIRRMMAYVKVPTREITVYHLRNYLASEKARGIADITLKGDREVFSAYFNWLQREKLITDNPTANLSPIKCAEKEKKIYSDAEYERLNKTCNKTRDLAIIHFLGASGCRVSEMTDLDRDDVDISGMEAVVRGKGNKERPVYLDQVATMYLKEYLDTRKDDNPALFLNRYGNRLGQGGVRCMLCTLAKKAKVDHVHPHKFRRTLATDLARRGMPVQEIAKIMGHVKLDTTMKYVLLNKEETKQSYRRYRK